LLSLLNIWWLWYAFYFLTSNIAKVCDE
jgi:hypothetical protein